MSNGVRTFIYWSRLIKDDWGLWYGLPLSRKILLRREIRHWLELDQSTR